MRVVSGVIAGLLLATTLTSASDADVVEPPAVEAVDVDTAAVPAVSEAAAARAERADKDASDLVAELTARRTGDFGLVGVTWTRGFDDVGMTVLVRLRTAGTWDDWTALDVESDEGDGGRDGTEPLWVGSADGVAVRVTSPTGDRPAGLTVSTIDPGTLATQRSVATASNAFYRTSSASNVTTIADGSPTFTGKPAIISRASWGAAKNTYCDSPRTGNESRGVVVHHTAGSNSYSMSQSKSIVRAVQAYHMKSRDWCDIGYNFLVDKYGQIFEGRNGGVDRPVRGAHAGDKTVNTYTMGVSMMGTFTSSEPSSALKSAMVRLIGWRVGTTFHPATGTYAVGSYSLNRIAGHRNVVSTACPGGAGYRWLSRSGGLRERVKAYVANYSSPIKTLRGTLGSTRTGPVYVGEYSASGGRKARLLNGDLYDKSGVGAFYVSGHFRTEFNSVGAQSGVLGFPTGNYAATPTAGVLVQTFERGRIYRVVRGTTTAGYALWGAIAAKYVELGETAGALGSPTKRETKLSDGSYRAWFDNGTITRQTSGDVVVALN